MSKIFGYGEDAFTLWALKHRRPKILKEFSDRTSPSDCLVFYRPSFGRSGGEKSSEFGEFDAILVSLENIYLIESKWDNLSRAKRGKVTIRPEQELRHHILTWYIAHWDKRYEHDWNGFLKEQEDGFQKEFKKYKKTMPRSDTLLAENLQFILNMLRKHCIRLSSEQNIKDVLLFFYNTDKCTTQSKYSKEFKLIKIDYSKDIEGNFINL